MWVEMAFVFIIKWFSLYLLQAEEKAHSEVKTILIFIVVYMYDEINIGTTRGLSDTVE